MHKPKKLWKVSEIAAHSGLTRQALHNYVLLGLIQEVERTPGGHRLYGDDVFGRLERIARLKRKGLTLREIGERLAAPPKRQRDGHDTQTRLGEVDHADEQG